MELDYVAIVVATLLQFVVGAIWYMGPFAKAWGKIHGFEKYSKAEQQKMMKEMPPYYLMQLIVTLVTTIVMAIFYVEMPADWNIYCFAALAWVGFVVPTQVSAVIFGGTEGKWILTKIAIMAGGSLACLMTAAATLSLL